MDITKLVDLAPTSLNIQSSSRYKAVHDAFHRRDLDDESHRRLQRLYRCLLQFCRATTYPELWSGLNLEEMKQDVRGLSYGSLADASPKQIKALHDLRGGTIFHLVFMGPEDTEATMPIEVVQTLAYDHAKLMRGLYPILDPQKSREEEAFVQVHTVDSYLKSWRGRVLVQNERAVRVEVTNQFEGAITCRCVETSALDRTLNNLANNAARFSAEPTLQLVVFQVSKLTRWCVLNKLTDVQSQWLENRMGENGLPLFEAGVTQGSSGLGLESCTDILGLVFGVSDKRTLVKSGYIGASKVDDRFCAWFHWPIYQPQPGDTFCGCA